MPDFNDNELDKLFQEAADQIRPEFDLKDWEQLSARLDQHDDKGLFYRNISLYSIAILLLLFTVQATWVEQRGVKPTSGTVTSSVKEIPFKNSNATNNKHINAKPNETLAQSKIVKIENDQETSVKIESKSNTKDLASSQALNHSEKNENKKDAHQVNQSDKSIAVLSKSSISQVDTRSKTNEDLQKDNNHNSLESNQTTIESRVLNNTEKSYANISKNNSSDLKRDQKDHALNIDNQRKDVTRSEIIHDKKDVTEISYLNSNKVSDSLSANKKSVYVLHSDMTNGKVDGTLNSDLNRDKKVNTSDADINKQNAHTEPTISKYDTTGAYDFNKNNKVVSLNSDKRSEDIDQPKIVLYNNDSTQNSHLNKNKEAHSLNTNRQSTDARHSNLIFSNSVDSTRINDSTKIEKEKLSELIDNSPEDSSDVRTDFKTRNLFIKLPISPDFTSVDYSSLGSSGINVGLLVEYAINKHIAFEAGAIWSKKLYDAHYAKVNSVKGDCRILDVPINIKYYVALNSRTNFFATVGFSSYVMLKEKYDYTVVTANKGELRWSAEYSKKNNEWFSMLNISIGVQRQISNRIWLQAEPFFKAPIAEVGAVNIKLVSMGAFLTLKYKLK